MLRVALSVLVLCLLVPAGGCGGSSSETPFPLEPDLSRLDAGPSSQPHYVVYSGDPEKKTKDADEPPAPEPEGASPEK